MASSSSSSKYDVFLSFRREDTGRTFVSHLCRSLEQKQIRTFKDEKQQTRDGRVSPEVARVIKESNIAVVVISENYAYSIWCLDVLANITEGSMVTIPVYYEVDPGDLTRPTGKFADDFRRHEETTNPETVDRWRNALGRLENTGLRFCSSSWEDDSTMLDDLIVSICFARNITAPVILPTQTQNQTQRRSRRTFFGSISEAIVQSSSLTMRLAQTSIDMEYIPESLSLSGETEYTDESMPGSEKTEHILESMSGSGKLEHIHESMYGSGETELERYAHEDTSVTGNMPNELPFPPSDDSNGLIGMDRHKKVVYGLLDLESKNQVRIIGIWGMEGVGKTTLTECVFEDISRHFHHHCFLTNVNNIHQNRISPSLLEHLIRTKSSNDNFDAIKPILVNRNILLVVDGVHDNEQLKDFVKFSHWLGPGSRVIMTSKDEDSLVSCGVKYAYEMECLRYVEALQLFSLFAFKRSYPLNGFERFSDRAVHFAGRLPLALKVLGSFLYGKDEESWKRTLHKLEASQDNGSRQVSNYIGACEYLPRR